MSSSSVAIPIALLGISLFQLQSSGTLDVLVGGFLDDSTLGLLDKLSVLGMLFALIFGAVALSSSISASSSSTSTKSKSNKVISYPIDKIDNAVSDKDKFLCLYEPLRDELLQHVQNEGLPQEAVSWLTRMMDVNVPGGKLNRGTTVVSVQRTLKGGHLSAKGVAQASVLGWAIEFLQAFFLVADDVMDASETRRGLPCWYKNPEVQMIAINDSFLLESFVFTLLKDHFGDKPYYFALVELFLDVIQKTEFGQLLDLTSQPMHAQKVDLARFTLTRYQQIVQYKTAYYTFYLPVAIGMITSGVQDPDAFDLAQRICLQMGEYFQIQDDYLDCFGDPAVIGKVGTDIQDNKCSWMVVQALKKATPAQMEILKENYGLWDDAKVAKVKALYKEMDLPGVFQKYEEDSYSTIQSELDKVKLMPRDVFELLLKKIYKRSK